MLSNHAGATVAELKKFGSINGNDSSGLAKL